jgi:hypothetical protein
MVVVVVVVVVVLVEMEQVVVVVALLADLVMGVMAEARVVAAAAAVVVVVVGVARRLQKENEICEDIDIIVLPNVKIRNRVPKHILIFFAPLNERGQSPQRRGTRFVTSISES